MEDRIYYFSNDDHKVHNINDISHQLVNVNMAEILDSEGFVNDEVELHTLPEILDILNS